MSVLAAGAVGACLLAVDVWRRPQRMAIMNAVWPVAALFGSVAVGWLYWRHGRAAPRGDPPPDDGPDHEDAGGKPPFAVAVAKGTLHCGAGCTLGDIVAEWLAFLVPSIAVAFGWKSVFADKMYAVWVLDFVVAFALGIVFQYWAIVPMRQLSFGRGVVAALKADALSLAAWQVGMYGGMAWIQRGVYAGLLGAPVEVNTTEFWFAMQLAMLAGFVTAYPVNWWLVRAGIKERM